MLSRWLDFWGFDSDGFWSPDGFFQPKNEVPRVPNWRFTWFPPSEADDWRSVSDRWRRRMICWRTAWRILPFKMKGGHMLDAAWCGLMRSFLVQRVEVLCRFLPQGRNSIWHNLIGSPWYYIIMWVRLQHMFGKQRTFHHQKLRLAVLLDTGEPIWLQPGAKLQVGRMDFGALYTWVEVGRWIWGSLLLRSRPRRFWAFHILLHVIWMIETSGTTARGLMRWCGGILTFLAFAHMLDADHTLMAILRRNECVRFGTEASKGFLLQNCSLLHQNRKLSFKGTQSQRSSCLLSRESHQSWPIFCHIRD